MSKKPKINQKKYSPSFRNLSKGEKIAYFILKTLSLGVFIYRGDDKYDLMNPLSQTTNDGTHSQKVPPPKNKILRKQEKQNHEKVF